MPTTNQSPLASNQYSLENISNPDLPFNPSDTSVDCSAQFSPNPQQSPLQWHPSTHDFRSQTLPQLEDNEQLGVPLLHPDSGLPITLDDHQSQTAPSPLSSDQLDTDRHPQLLPIAQSPVIEQHIPTPPSILDYEPLPNLPLYILPLAEDEFDQERLVQLLERLKNANNRLTPEAPQQMETANAIASDTGFDGANAPAQLPILNVVRSSEGQDGENGYMEEASNQGCSGGAAGSQDSADENNPDCETESEELLLAQAERGEGHEQSRSAVQQEGIEPKEKVLAQPSGVVDADEDSSNPSLDQVQRDVSAATNSRDQPRRTGRKRRRAEVETGYWLRSRKPSSSSKRSRRTSYWLRP